MPDLDKMEEAFDEFTEAFDQAFDSLTEVVFQGIDCLGELFVEAVEGVSPSKEDSMEEGLEKDLKGSQSENDSRCRFGPNWLWLLDNADAATTESDKIDKF